MKNVKHGHSVTEFDASKVENEQSVTEFLCFDCVKNNVVNQTSSIY